MFKKIQLFVIAILFVNTAIARKVRFAVDMSQQTINTAGVFIMADFQAMKGFGANFDPGICAMTVSPTNANIFYYTIDLPAFQKFEYGFANGVFGYDIEFIPLESRASDISDYRWVYVDSLDADTMKLDPVLYSENHPQDKLLMRFKVDMQNETVSTYGVHVAGDFQFNNPASHRMYSFGNNIYELIVHVDTTLHNYRFFNGNTLLSGETVPSTCATNAKRTHNLTIDYVLPTVCFGSCAVCTPSNVKNFNTTLNGSLHPNPMTNETTLTFSKIGNYKIELFDILGKSVKTINVKQSKKAIISNTNLKTGSYLVLIIDEENNHFSKQLIVN